MQTFRHTSSCCALERWVAMFVLLSCAPLAAAQPVGRPAASDEPLLRMLAEAAPRSARDLSAERAGRIEKLTPQVETWIAAMAAFQGLQRPEQYIDRIDQLLSARQRIEELCDAMLAIRGEVGTIEPDTDRVSAARHYLRIVAALVDLASRARYLLFDAIEEADYQTEVATALTERLIDVLSARRSAVGGSALSPMLLERPDPESTPTQLGAALRLKARELELLAATRQVDALDTIATMLRAPELPPELVLAAVRTVYLAGVPQTPRPGSAEKIPPPALSAATVRKQLMAIPPTAMHERHNKLREELVSRLQEPAERGNATEYRWGNLAVRPGDWLLMRNPSPYNRFTDVSPGLFTHVGVIAAETGSDGVRRMVVVDLPERGTQIQATNFDVFMRRTLHCLVLRHPDPAAAQVMASSAESIIGNPSQFDLNFRTDRVAELRGQPLAGKTIHTYCAGLLLLCAQETGLPRGEFFPITETAAGGHTAANLAKLGLSFGDQFVSPTGALFSPKLEIVGRTESMYDPGREVEEAIYDHFASRLSSDELHPAPDLFQALRLKVAEAGRTNPLLAQALAAAAGVSENTDLVAAAKAAAVIETLDEIAKRGSAAYNGARASLRAGSVEQELAAGRTEAEISAINAYRERHADLYQQWLRQAISPRQMRVELVRYYIAKGERQLDERFFQAAPASTTK